MKRTPASDSARAASSHPQQQSHDSTVPLAGLGHAHWPGPPDELPDELPEPELPDGLSEPELSDGLELPEDDQESDEDEPGGTMRVPSVYPTFNQNSDPKSRQFALRGMARGQPRARNPLDSSPQAPVVPISSPDQIEPGEAVRDARLHLQVAA